MRDTTAFTVRLVCTADKNGTTFAQEKRWKSYRLEIDMKYLLALPYSSGSKFFTVYGLSLINRATYRFYNEPRVNAFGKIFFFFFFIKFGGAEELPFYIRMLRAHSGRRRYG